MAASRNPCDPTRPTLTSTRAVDEMVKSKKRNALADPIGTGVFGTTETELRRRRHRKHRNK